MLSRADVLRESAPVATMRAEVARRRAALEAELAHVEAALFSLDSGDLAAAERQFRARPAVA
ncbi:MAG TPA: hypothetical protein VMA73_15630 [Streptosporangiaceae bacterium]|nr:hypothetical protein [Streptosporangiaceae bacterium]